MTVQVIFGKCFARSKRKMLLQDWIGSKPNLGLVAGRRGELDEVDGISYLDNCISPDGHTSDEVSPSIEKARLAFTNLRYLWRQYDIGLSITDRLNKSRMVGSAVRFRKRIAERGKCARTFGIGRSWRENFPS